MSNITVTKNNLYGYCKLADHYPSKE